MYLLSINVLKNSPNNAQNPPEMEASRHNESSDSVSSTFVSNGCSNGTKTRREIP